MDGVNGSIRGDIPAGMGMCKGTLAKMFIAYRGVHRGIRELLVVALSYFWLSWRYMSKEDSLLIRKK